MYYYWLSKWNDHEQYRKMESWWIQIKDQHSQEPGLIADIKKGIANAMEPNDE